jgi:CBS domain-containing protein
MDTVVDILEDKGREMLTVLREDTVHRAVEIMCEAHVGALLVMDADRLVGIISERDVMTRVVLAGLNPRHMFVVEAMTRGVTRITCDASAEEAMAIMTERRVRHLPVVDGMRVVGIISIGDLVRWTIRDREHQIQQMQDYVAGRYPG